MEKEDLEERLKQEIETEARILERRVNTKKELASLKMPEDSYEQLMKQIREKEQSKFRWRSLPRKSLATVAMVVVLIAITGLGVNGARLYTLNITSQEKVEAFDIITDTENILYVELTEKEAYGKIEENIGILALRLGYKPNGMELEKVYISKDMGEAVMEFHYNEHIFSIYENKQNRDASFNTHLDGKEISTIEIFHLGQTIDIREIDKTDGAMFYRAQIEFGNAYYLLSSDVSLEEFENILYGIIFLNE